MADMTDGERIAEERIAEAARTGQDWLDLGDLGLEKLPDALSKLTKLKRLSLGTVFQVNTEGVNVRSRATARGSLADINAISHLDDLRELYIENTECDDLAPIKDLRRLQKLKCRDTKISSLAPLEKLSGLQELSCERTLVSDLTPIQGLDQLRHIDISQTEIRDLSALSALKKLTHLECNFTKVASLLPIASINKLQILGVRSTAITSLASVQALHELMFLDCSDTHIENLDPLLLLRRLQSLKISGTKITDLSPINHSFDLRILQCNDSEISDITSISGLTKLQALDCAKTRISDLLATRNLVALQYLDCSNTKVSDLYPIQDLQRITYLNCSDTEINDLSPAAKLVGLQHLFARNCLIPSLPGSISNLQALESLHLQKNFLRSLPSQLGSLTKLERAAARPYGVGSYGLFLEGNPLTPPIPELLAPGQPQATINVLRWLRGEPIEPEAQETDPTAPEKTADDPPAIPEQGAGPRVVLDQTGRLVFAKPSDLDAKGNDRNRLEALHPALREAAADLTKALQDHPSNLRNERLLQRAEAYRALVDLPLDEVNFARLYGAGMQLLNAAAATREALEAGRVDVPDLTQLQKECLKNIEGLHPPFVLSSRDGQEMLADQTTIKLTADHVLAVKEAGTAFGEALLHRPDLAAPGIGQTIKDAAAEIGKGDNPAREAVNALYSARNTVVVAAWIATAASLTVGGAAYYGSAGAVLGMIPGVLLIESVKSSAVFKDLTKRGGKTIDWSDEKIAALGARLKHWQELLGQNAGHLRKLAQVPKFEWLGPVIDWLKRKSPPDKKEVTIRRVPRCFDLHAVLGAMFCCFFQFQGSNS
jgi:Leucine-rich repeat (LRR) protein